MEFTWTSRVSLNGVRALDLLLPMLTDSRLKAHLPQKPTDAKDPQSIGLPVGSTRIIARYDELPGDPPQSRIRFRRVLVPHEPGTYYFAPSTLLCSYFEPKDQRFRGARYPSYFNNDFFDHDLKGEFERLLTRSEPLALTVDPLPAAGRPDSFDGIVGEFSIQAEATPQVLTTGEQVTLTLRATGHPFPQVLELPALASRRALPHSFAIPRERAHPRIENGIHTIRQSLRPLRANLPAIPPLRFSFFDPETGQYGEAATEAIPLTVSEAAKVTSFDAQLNAGSPLKNRVQPTPPGITHNRTGPQVLDPQTPPGSLARSGKFWIPVLILPPLLCALGIGILSRRRREARDPPPPGHAAPTASSFRTSRPTASRDPSAPPAATSPPASTSTPTPLPPRKSDPA